MFACWERPRSGYRYLVSIDTMTGASQVAGLDPDCHSVTVWRKGYWEPGPSGLRHRWHRHAMVARTYRRVSKFGSDSMTGEDGTSIIRVDFSDQAGTLRLLTHGTRFTQFEPAVQSQQVAYGWNDGSGAEPIANGEGASKDVGTVSAKVRAYTRDSSGITLPRLIELQNLQAVNQTPVSLPPIYGENVPWTINPGQARYHSFRLETEQGLAVVEHTLLLAVDHKYRWRKEDDKGNAIGPVQEREIYQPMSFAGLW